MKRLSLLTLFLIVGCEGSVTGRSSLGGEAGNPLSSVDYGTVQFSYQQSQWYTISEGTGSKKLNQKPKASKEDTSEDLTQSENESQNASISFFYQDLPNPIATFTPGVCGSVGSEPQPFSFLGVIPDEHIIQLALPTTISINGKNYHRYCLENTLSGVTFIADIKETVPNVNGAQVTTPEEYFTPVIEMKGLEGLSQLSRGSSFNTVGAVNP